MVKKYWVMNRYLNKKGKLAKKDQRLINALKLTSKTPEEYDRIPVVKLSEVLAKLEEFEKWTVPEFLDNQDVIVIKKEDWRKLKEEIWE